jgi:flagellar protein FlgJ
MHRVCLAATAALPLACAAALPAHHDVTTPASGEAQGGSGVPVPSPEAAHTMVALARVASSFDPSIAAALVEPLLQWQHDLRDQWHTIEAGVAAFNQETHIVLPDLTVLSTEPVARSESSGFGWRDDPIRHTRRFHSGTDFRGDYGTPVLAAGDGLVAYCGRLGGYGNVIDIDHGGGVITRYAHLRRIDTKKFAAVTAGERIGQVGSTGRATGPHLHFEVRIDGAPVSPIAAMSVAALQREIPFAGRLAALVLSPELQSTAESDVDPPKQHARPAERPERSGRTKRAQVLW